MSNPNRDDDALQRLVIQRERELELISNEIHDDVLQHFIAARMSNDAYCTALIKREETVPNELIRVRDLLDQGLAAARRLMDNLQSIDFGTTPLSICLDSLGKIATNDSGIHFDVQCHVSETLDNFTQLILYRIAQEAMTNVSRHSQASVAHIFLSITPKLRELSIEDNGIGFDPHKVDNNCFGLRSIRERAEIIQGTVEITSRAAATKIVVRF